MEAGGPPMSRLLGVGSKSSFKIHSTLLVHLRKPPAYNSLLPTRDTLASIAAPAKLLRMLNEFGTRE